MRRFMLPPILLSLGLAGAASADSVRAVGQTIALPMKAPVGAPLVTRGTAVPEPPATPPGVPVPYPNAAAVKGGTRAYGLDRAAGTVRFGDGAHGRPPPSGSGNVTGTYRRGSGVTGNLPATAVGPRRPSAAPTLRLTPLDDARLGKPVMAAEKPGDDARHQEAAQKQSRHYQSMSNVRKAADDTGKSIIQNTR